MISIVIPAYNEQAVIGRCLRALTQRPVDGGIEIIVACNGCHDDTAEIARQFGPPVRVVETQQASKIVALNLGDQAATGFPRVFLDADVEVALDTIEAVAAHLREGKVHAVAPAMHVDTSGASILVKAFYKVWLSQPYHRRGLIGGGFYAISQEGRARFDQFPDVIADDEFVRAQFADDERLMLHDHRFTIRAPHTVRDLVRVKTRSRLGLWQLRRRYPHLQDNSTINPWEGRRIVLTRPWLWPAAVVFLGVNIAIRIRAKRQWKTIDNYQWERDESSRHAAATGA